MSLSWIRLQLYVPNLQPVRMLLWHLNVYTYRCACDVSLLPNWHQSAAALLHAILMFVVGLNAVQAVS